MIEALITESNVRKVGCDRSILYNRRKAAVGRVGQEIVPDHPDFAKGAICAKRALLEVATNGRFPPAGTPKARPTVAGREN